jgi:hypothetical protein
MMAVTRNGRKAAQKIGLKIASKVAGGLAKVLNRLGMTKGALFLAKLGMKAGTLAAQKAAQLLASKTAIKVATAAGNKVGQKMAIAAAGGPAAPFIAAGLLAFDALSMTLDILDATLGIAGYATMGSNRNYLSIRDNINATLKQAIEEAGGSYPGVVGPLDKIDLTTELGKQIDAIIADATHPLSKPMLDKITADVTDGTYSDETDYSALLDLDAITNQATGDLCTKYKGKMVKDSKGMYQCSYPDRKSCETSYSWPLKEPPEDAPDIAPPSSVWTPPTETYAEYKNTVYGGACIGTSYALRGICETANIPYDSETGSCRIDENYCRMKGAEWKKGSDGIGDCHVPAGQNFAELMFGTTVVRGLTQLFDPDQYSKCAPGQTDSMYACHGCPEGWEARSDLNDAAVALTSPSAAGAYAMASLQPLMMCFPKCRPGYHAFGMNICTPDCPTGWRDDGATCVREDYCPPDKPRNIDGLCFENCREGYSPTTLGLCAKNCPPNTTTETAALCTIGGRVIPNPNQKGVGTVPGLKPCPSGQRDDGSSCWLDQHNRGVGKIPEISCPGGFSPRGLGSAGWCDNSPKVPYLRRTPRISCKGDKNHKIWELTSSPGTGAGGPYTFWFSSKDGNLCIRDKAGTVMNCTNTYPGGGGRVSSQANTPGPFKLVLQTDGNLVISTAEGKSSETCREIYGTVNSAPFNRAGCEADMGCKVITMGPLWSCAGNSSPVFPDTVIWASGSNRDTGWYDYTDPDVPPPMGQPAGAAPPRGTIQKTMDQCNKEYGTTFTGPKNRAGCDADPACFPTPIMGNDAYFSCISATPPPGEPVKMGTYSQLNPVGGIIPADTSIQENTMIYSSDNAFYLVLRSSDRRLVIYESGLYPGDLDNGLCYPACPQGYSKAGPTCTPNGGARITMNLANRQICKDGKQMVAGLCYEPCPIDKPYINDGMTCREPINTITRDTYSLPIGTPDTQIKTKPLAGQKGGPYGRGVGKLAKMTVKHRVIPLATPNQIAPPSAPPDNRVVIKTKQQCLDQYGTSESGFKNKAGCAADKGCYLNEMGAIWTCGSLITGEQKPPAVPGPKTDAQCLSAYGSNTNKPNDQSGCAYDEACQVLGDGATWTCTSSGITPSATAKPPNPNAKTNEQCKQLYGNFSTAPSNRAGCETDIGCTVTNVMGNNTYWVCNSATF